MKLYLVNRILVSSYLEMKRKKRVHLCLILEFQPKNSKNGECLKLLIWKRKVEHNWQNILECMKQIYQQ